MTPDFDLATSYKNDFELADFVEDVTWELNSDDKVTGLHGQFQNIRESDIASAGTGVGFTTDSVPVVVWQPNAVDGNAVAREFAPAPGHILRRTTHQNEGWLILDTEINDFGYWVCHCQREVVNG